MNDRDQKNNSQDESPVPKSPAADDTDTTSVSTGASDKPETGGKDESSAPGHKRGANHKGSERDGLLQQDAKDFLAEDERERNLFGDIRRV